MPRHKDPQQKVQNQLSHYLFHREKNGGGKLLKKYMYLPQLCIMSYSEERDVIQPFTETYKYM